MTPLHFENLYRAEWDELESQLTLILDFRPQVVGDAPRVERFNSS